DVRDVFRHSKEEEAELVYGTTDAQHPGVAQLYAQDDLLVGGDVRLLERPAPLFPDLALDPADTRRVFAERGWRTVVGFQTRNPVHRAHEYIQKAVLETVDGLLLHPLLGPTKDDDVPAAVRVASYRVLLERYYPRDRVLLAGSKVREMLRSGTLPPPEFSRPEVVQVLADGLREVTSPPVPLEASPPVPLSAMRRGGTKGRYV